MSFILILNLVGTLIIAIFVIWNWFLACTGVTTVEFMKGIASYSSSNENEDEAQVAFNSVYDNLFRVFGTNKLFRMLSPSFRNVPMTGLEWSFLWRDEGFSENGIKL